MDFLRQRALRYLHCFNPHFRSRLGSLPLPELVYLHHKGVYHFLLHYSWFLLTFGRYRALSLVLYSFRRGGIPVPLPILMLGLRLDV